MLPQAGVARKMAPQFRDHQRTKDGLSVVLRGRRSRHGKEPDIAVEVTTVRYPERQQHHLTAVQGGNAPDIAAFDQIWIDAFAGAGAIADLTARAEASGLSRDASFGGARNTAVDDGMLRRIPGNVDVWQFSFLNVAILELAGVPPEDPATFDGLREAAEKMSVDNRFGVKFWPALEQPTSHNSQPDRAFATGTAPLGEIPVGTFGGGTLAVPERSETKEAAWRFSALRVNEQLNSNGIDLIPANIAAAVTFPNQNRTFPNQNRKSGDRILARLENSKPRPPSPRCLENANAQTAH